MKFAGKLIHGGPVHIDYVPLVAYSSVAFMGL